MDLQIIGKMTHFISVIRYIFFYQVKILKVFKYNFHDNFTLTFIFYTKERLLISRTIYIKCGILGQCLITYCYQKYIFQEIKGAW